MNTAPGRTWSSLGEKPVEVLKGVGERRREALEALGIFSVADLLTHYPRRYVDATKQMAISQMKLADQATILVRVRKVNMRRTRSGRTLVEVELSDGTGYLRATFFNQAWRARQLTPGMEVAVFGKLESYRGRSQMSNPMVDLVGDRVGRVVVIYPMSEKAAVTTREIGAMVAEAIERAGVMADPVPRAALSRLGLISRTEALALVHRPSSMEEAEKGRRRLAFDELFRLQVALVARKKGRELEERGVAHRNDTSAASLVGQFISGLSFSLTNAQNAAIAAVAADMSRSVPMHRLLQGDVGSGKTVVAAAALLLAVQGGHQGALLAPTEVLAEQHFASISGLLANLVVPDPDRLGGDRPLRVGLLVGRAGAAERRRISEGLANGQIDMVVGTHALLSEGVSFASLGAVVVDEQHRFGVEQRALLSEKGRQDGSFPDLLVMTATPIPRTAAMTVYGDLDVTVIDELPAGRVPIETRWCKGADTEDAWERVRSEVAAGRRAYVVCPLVEESSRMEAASVTEEQARLSAGELSGLRLGLLHGQMPGAELEATMAAFRAGELDVLVATTVIEVGVDVAQATVMVVEDADRFGIAQLHQLRGRVGRGSWPSWCYLLSADQVSDDAAERLAALEKSTDGFELAEVDLRLRGEGTVLGTRQQGRSDLKLASLARDLALVGHARTVAFELVGEDPSLSAHPRLVEELRYFVGEEAEFLLKS